MKINSVGHEPPVPVNHGQQRKAEAQQADGGDKVKPPKPDHATKGESGQPRGVIRLLQEGHFKGVADVRLRINFADELSALSQSSLRGAVSGDVSAVLAAVDTEVNEFLASDEFDEAFVQAVRGAQDAFDSSVNDLATAFGEASDPATADLLAGIQAAYDGFVSALTEIFTQDEGGIGEVVGDGVEAPPIPVEGETIPADAPPPPTTTISTELQSFLDKLTTAFDSALTSFGNSLTQASEVLPPLSEPSGNGAAYEKFLAILNGLNAVTDDSPATPPNDLDTVV